MQLSLAAFSTAAHNEQTSNFISLHQTKLGQVGKFSTYFLYSKILDR